MKTLFLSTALFVCLILGVSNNTYSQDADVYDQGTVWSLTFVRTGANVADDYLKDLTKTWKASMEEAKKEGNDRHQNQEIYKSVPHPSRTHTYPPHSAESATKP